MTLARYRYKALVLSDTHGNTEAVKRLLPHMNACDLVIHLGDGNADLFRFRSEIQTRLCCVRGNNDPDSVCEDEAVTELGPRKIYLTHGHRLSVYGGTGALTARAGALGCDVVLYGHTHIACIAKAGEIDVMNPGSLSLPRAGSPSYGILYGNDKFFLKIIVI